MKVYIVTTGSYSSYGISQVFQNKADAEQYAATFSGSSDAEVEEYELREGPVKKRARWHLQWYSCLPAFLDLGVRKIRYEVPEPRVWSYDEDDLGEQIKISVTWVHEKSYGDRDVLSINGPSEEAVRKVFSEQRAQYLARKEDIS